MIRYGINNFVYSARRPFNPRRLFTLVHDKFILLQNSVPEDNDEDGDGGGDDDDDNDTDGTEADDESIDGGEAEAMQDVEDFEQQDPKVILKNKREHPAFHPVLRSKGFFWLATRPFQFGEWSQAGGMLTVGCGGPWFTYVPEEDWPEDKDVRKSIQNDFQEPWGDSRQEIVFIGESIDTDKITACLDDCLLNDEEMGKFKKVMNNKRLSKEQQMNKLGNIWEDGWEDWPEFDFEEGLNGEPAQNDVESSDGKKSKRLISEHLNHVNGHNHSSHKHKHGH